PQPVQRGGGGGLRGLAAARVRGRGPNRRGGRPPLTRSVPESSCTSGFIIQATLAFDRQNASTGHGRYPISPIGSLPSPAPVAGPLLPISRKSRGSSPMKHSLIAIALAASLPLAANAAEGVSYNYLEAGY